MLPAAFQDGPVWQAVDHREVVRGDRCYLFLVPQTSLVGIDDIAAAVIADLRHNGPAGAFAVSARLSGRYSAAEIDEACRELAQVGAVMPHLPTGPGSRVAIAPHSAEAAEAPAKAIPISTLVLSLAHSCNLACSYCYAGGGDYGGPKVFMKPDVAAKSVDFLLASSGDLPSVTVIFFGGEPLLNWSVIRETVIYAEAAAARAGKHAEFAMTTNGTLLTPEICRFCDEHQVGVTISMDGPAEVHNANRPLAGGGGSYDQVLRGARLAVGHIRSKPVGCRVTVARGFGDLTASFHHLLSLGFHEVGFAPVTEGPEGQQLDADDLQLMLGHFKALGEKFLAAADSGRFFGFSNLMNMLWDLHSGNHKVYPCGAGIGFFAVGPDGNLSLCHRFTGQDEHVYGDIEHGVNTRKQAELLRWGHVGGKDRCRSCWLRHLCAGGCYHEAEAHYGDVRVPNLHYCKWLADWTEYCMQVYVTLLEDHPAFLERLFRHRIPDPGF